MVNVLMSITAPENIASLIGDMAILCRRYGVNSIFVLAPVCRGSKFLN